MMDFDSWWEKQGEWPSEYTAACAAWQAAQKAERERAKGLVDALMACDEAMGYMSEYDIPLTLPKQVKDAITKYEGEANDI